MMTKITEIDRPRSRIITERAEDALQVLAGELGMTLTRETSRFTSEAITVKMTFKTVGDDGRATKDASDAHLLGLPADCIGRRFKSGRTTYTITGIVMRRPKYPISAVGPKGGRYKFPVAAVLAGIHQHSRRNHVQ